MKSATRSARIVLILSLFLFFAPGCCSLIGTPEWSHQFAGSTENFDGLEVSDYTALRVQTDNSHSGRDIIITLWKSDDHSFSDIVLFCRFPLNRAFTFHGDTRTGDLDAWLMLPKSANEDADAPESLPKVLDNLPSTQGEMLDLEARNPNRIYRMTGTIDLKMIKIDHVENSVDHLKIDLATTRPVEIRNTGVALTTAPAGGALATVKGKFDGYWSCFIVWP